jgi:hypothetical protein
MVVATTRVPAKGLVLALVGIPGGEQMPVVKHYIICLGYIIAPEMQ